METCCVASRANRIGMGVGRRGLHLIRRLLKLGVILLAGAALLLVLDATLLRDDGPGPAPGR